MIVLEFSSSGSFPLVALINRHYHQDTLIQDTLSQPAEAELNQMEEVPVWNPEGSEWYGVTCIMLGVSLSLSEPRCHKRPSAPVWKADRYGSEKCILPVLPVMAEGYSWDCLWKILWQFSLCITWLPGCHLVQAAFGSNAQLAYLFLDTVPDVGYFF